MIMSKSGIIVNIVQCGDSGDMMLSLNQYVE